MAVLLGLLIAFGRFSADREFVAMQACGVSIYRLLRPVAVVALLRDRRHRLRDDRRAARFQSGLPRNHLREVASTVENNIRPRVLFTEFPNHVLYVRELGDDHVMRDVFFTDTSKPGATRSTSRARAASSSIARTSSCSCSWRMAPSTAMKAADQDEYEGAQFESLSLSLDAQTGVPTGARPGPQEMTIAELRKTIAAVKPGDRLASTRA